MVRGSCYAVWFQVLSWQPRALYFPNFATPEQCESIIKMAKSKLKPSTLALRKGETTESTKGTRTRQAISLSLPFSVQYTFFFSHKHFRSMGFSHLFDFKTHGNSSGTFIGGSEDKTGTLDFIERKIAKATMIPQSHGEVFSCC